LLAKCFFSCPPSICTCVYVCVLENVHEVDPADFYNYWKINVFGAFLATQKVLPGMLKQKNGTIIFTGTRSSSVHQPSFINKHQHLQKLLIALFFHRYLCISSGPFLFNLLHSYPFHHSLLLQGQPAAYVEQQVHIYIYISTCIIMLSWKIFFFVNCLLFCFVPCVVLYYDLCVVYLCQVFRLSALGNLVSAPSHKV